MSRVAAFDIGTVTARLAIADVDDAHVSRLAKQSRICDLGEGVNETRRLTEGAMDRVTAACSDFVRSARESDVTLAATTLTSAARDAENSADLLERLRDLGLEPQVIPGTVEGSLTFLGVAQDFPGQRIVIADNGGGSTEFAIGRLDGVRPSMEYVRSVDVGCRRVTEECLSADDPPSKAGIERAHEFCREGLVGGMPWLRGEASRPERLVVTGGTVTSLVAIDAALDPYDSTYVHLHELDLQTVERVEALLAQLTLEEKEHVIGLQPKRAPVILGGAIAICELLRASGFDKLTVSESDLLFGLSIAIDEAAAGREVIDGWKPSTSSLG